MPNVNRRSVLPDLVLALAAACHDGAAASPAAEPPSIRFMPQVVSFPTGANGAGLTTAVAATVTGLGPSPTFRWESRAPDAVAIDSVTQNGTGVWLRGVWPRGTYIVLTATGTTTIVDSLVVAQGRRNVCRVATGASAGYVV